MRPNVTPIPETLDSGKGPAVVFANSAVTDYTMFQPQIDAVAQYYRVIAHNTRSLTQRWATPYTLWDLVEEWRGLLDDRGVERAVLVGSSMGGYLALRFALRYPERTAGLVLLATTAQDNTEDEVSTFLAKFNELAGQERMPVEWASWCSTVLFSARAHAAQPDLVHGWLDRAVSLFPGEPFIEEARCWLLREDVTDRLGSIAAPALVLHGADDGAIPVERARPMAKLIPNAQMMVVEGAGHLVNLEAPDQINDALLAFLGEVYGMSGKGHNPVPAYGRRGLEGRKW